MFGIGIPGEIICVPAILHDFPGSALDIHDLDGHLLLFVFVCKGDVLDLGDTVDPLDVIRGGGLYTHGEMTIVAVIALVESFNKVVVSGSHGDFIRSHFNTGGLRLKIEVTVCHVFGVVLGFQHLLQGCHVRAVGHVRYEKLSLLGKGYHFEDVVTCGVGPEEALEVDEALFLVNGGDV